MCDSAFMREVENVEALPSRATHIDLGNNGRTPWEGIIKVRRARQGRQVVGKGTPGRGENIGKALEV